MTALGTRVRFTRRAGRYRFWDSVPEGLPDPDGAWGDPAPYVTSKDGIPELERAKIVAGLVVDDATWAQDGVNYNDGTCGIHEWEQPGEGVIVGRTHREWGVPVTDDDGKYLTMAPPFQRQAFWEVRESLRGRRWLVPLDAIEPVMAEQAPA